MTADTKTPRRKRGEADKQAAALRAIAQIVVAANHWDQRSLREAIGQIGDVKVGLL